MATRLHSRLRFAPAEVRVETRPDGSTRLSSPQPLRAYERCIGEWLLKWVQRAPERTFLAERQGEGWRKMTYAQALEGARRVGEALLELGLGPEKPLAILSDNSIDHGVLALGAMHAGVPVAPISPAYSLMSKDFAKLKAIFELLKPGLVWADDPKKYGAALAAVGAEVTPLAKLLDGTPGARVDEAFARVGPDTVAKILFTSGSTGLPKGVINTQRMLVSNQQMLVQAWPFLEDRVQTIVDWLPWNHTFGGNFCFNMMLRNGGSFYIDGGKPAPGLIETTARNLKEVSPTLYFNVPRGFDLLLPFLEQDADLRRNFFRDLDMLFYAAAALPQNLWERLEAMATAEKNGELAMISSWGSTETAPSAAAVHYHIERAGVIGLPNPGCELKLVPSAGKLEVRVRGPNVTPGYFRRGDLTRAAFDEEGFYRIGDAMKFADPAAPWKGLVFDGRVAEDFKLSSGTWVHVGAVRVKLIAAGNPLIQDAVITGHDRDEVGALIFLSPAAKDLAPEALRAKIAAALASLAAEGGGSMHPTRALITADPPSIDANEITDKGYINQRAVLARRAAQVEKLHAKQPGAEVITAAG
jgi:feruloyl-CoA synthase